MDTITNQLDLFIAQPSDVRHKDLAAAMALNWHSLAKRLRHDPINHETAGYQVQISNTHGDGIATIWDHDVVIFLISQLVAASNRGEPISNRIRFSGYELHRFLAGPLNRSRGGKSDYQRLWAALNRLHHTAIRTTQTLAGAKGPTEKVTSFYWLPRIERVARADGTNVGFEVVLDQVLFNWVRDKANVLSLDLGYFGLKSGLARWVYLWMRKSVGTEPGRTWSESARSIYKKSASQSPFRVFLSELKRIAAASTFPHYELTIEMTSTPHRRRRWEPTLTVRRRPASLADLRLDQRA